MFSDYFGIVHTCIIYFTYILLLIHILYYIKYTALGLIYVPLPL